MIILEIVGVVGRIDYVEVSIILWRNIYLIELVNLIGSGIIWCE